MFVGGYLLTWAAAGLLGYAIIQGQLTALDLLPQRNRTERLRPRKERKEGIGIHKLRALRVGIPPDQIKHRFALMVDCQCRSRKQSQWTDMGAKLLLDQRLDGRVEVCGGTG